MAGDLMRTRGGGSVSGEPLPLTLTYSFQAASAAASSVA